MFKIIIHLFTVQKSSTLKLDTIIMVLLLIWKLRSKLLLSNVINSVIIFKVYTREELPVKLNTLLLYLGFV